MNDDLPVYLLGAGASKDAGLPLASGITEIALRQLNDDTSRSHTTAPLLNYVVSAMMAHAGRSGTRPDVFPDIESDVTAVDLLSQRAELEISPFVQAWDPAAGLLGLANPHSSLPGFLFRDVRKALVDNDPFGERKFVDAINAVMDRRVEKRQLNCLPPTQLGTDPEPADHAGTRQGQ